MNIIEYITTLESSYAAGGVYRHHIVNISNLLIGVNKHSTTSYWLRIWMKSNSGYIELFTADGLVLKNDIIERVTSAESIEMIEMFKKIQTEKQLEEFGNKLVKLKVFS